MFTRRTRRAITIVEMLVVIGVLGLLMGLLFPALRSVRQSAMETHCASNLRQIGLATVAYMDVWKGHLPQVAVFNEFTGEDVINGSLFGGKRGELPMLGVNEYGINERPLNAFIGDGQYVFDDTSEEDINEDIPVFESPLDQGQPAQPPFVPGTDSLYDLVGTSYTLNDHALDGDDCATLVPTKSLAGEGTVPGGRMPRVETPATTWMVAPIPIYNYQEGGDRGQQWHTRGVVVNLFFVDGHLATSIDVPEGIVNTTDEYTFLPAPDWDCEAEALP